MADIAGPQYPAQADQHKLSTLQLRESQLQQQVAQLEQQVVQLQQQQTSDGEHTQQHNGAAASQTAATGGSRHSRMACSEQPGFSRYIGAHTCSGCTSAIAARLPTAAPQAQHTAAAGS
jgi:DNA-binding transcriptional MerR regulator